MKKDKKWVYQKSTLLLPDRCHCPRIDDCCRYRQWRWRWRRWYTCCNRWLLPLRQIPRLTQIPHAFLGPGILHKLSHNQTI